MGTAAEDRSLIERALLRELSLDERGIVLAFQRRRQQGRALNDKQEKLLGKLIENRPVATPTSTTVNFGPIPKPPPLRLELSRRLKFESAVTFPERPRGGR